MFFAGPALVPVGVYLSKRQIRDGYVQSDFDLKAALRRIAWFFVVVTVVNILVGTQLTYMETPQFCGASCHTMAPELAAYRNSPDSRVECVDCHVAPGAVGWVNSKTNGLHQLVATVFGTMPRPIPSALESNRLVPARETCEHCHWPQNLDGTRLRVLSKFADDEKNTRSKTVFLMLVGGNTELQEFTVRISVPGFTSVLPPRTRPVKPFRGLNTATQRLAILGSLLPPTPFCFRQCAACI